MQGSSDPDVFEQLFRDDELRFIEQLSNISTIVDLGANVGYASARFLSAFPNSTVIAVEPDPGNAIVCRVNLAPYGRRASLLEGGIWHTAGGLVLIRGAFRDGREWTTQVGPARDGETPDVIAYDIDSITRGTIDLLKIDIEGSEAHCSPQTPDGSIASATFASKPMVSNASGLYSMRCLRTPSSRCVPANMMCFSGFVAAKQRTAFASHCALVFH